MRKHIVLFITAVLFLQLSACTKKYKVEIANHYPIENELAEAYAAGETVTIQLATVTESYYVLWVNGVEQAMDRSTSNMTYTYFHFIMPREDVLIKIEDHSVDIPET